MYLHVHVQAHNQYLPHILSCIWEHRGELAGLGKRLPSSDTPPQGRSLGLSWQRDWQTAALQQSDTGSQLHLCIKGINRLVSKVIHLGTREGKEREEREMGRIKRERVWESIPSSIELFTSSLVWSNALISIHNTVSMSTELNWDATPVSPPLHTVSSIYVMYHTVRSHKWKYTPSPLQFKQMLFHSCSFLSHPPGP